MVIVETNVQINSGDTLDLDSWYLRGSGVSASGSGADTVTLHHQPRRNLDKGHLETIPECGKQCCWCNCFPPLRSWVRRS